MRRRQVILGYSLGLLLLVALLAGRLIAGAAGFELLRLAWGFAALVALALVFRHLERLLSIPLSAEAKFFALLLVFPALLRSFDGPRPGLSLLVLALALGGLALGRRREAPGGALLGLALPAKSQLLLVIPWLLHRRRWRAACGMAIVAAPLLAALYWVALRLEPGAPRPALAWPWESGEAAGAGLRAWLGLALERGPASLDAPGLLGAEGLHLLASLAIVALLLQGARRRYGGGPMPSSSSEIAAALGAAAFLGPRSGLEDLVLFLPAAALGFEAARRCPRGLRPAGGLLWGLAALCSLAALLQELRLAPSGLDGPSFLGLAGAPLLVLTGFPGFLPRVSYHGRPPGQGSPRPKGDGETG
jgi:hypothetical protein